MKQKGYMVSARTELALAKATAKPKPPPAPAQAAKPAPKPVKVKGRGVKNSAPKPESPPAKPADKPVETTKKPKPEMVVPTSPADIVNNLIARKQDDPNAPPVEPVSETVNTLVRLNSAISKGADIGEFKSDIVRIVSHQPEKADVFQSVLNLIDQERTTDMVEIRAGVEKDLKRAVKAGGLTTSECLAVWQLANNIIKENQAKAAKLNKAVDSITVVEKVDYHQIHAERVIQQKWEGTTPQGRQIIRMKLFDLKRHVQAAQQPEQPVIDVPAEKK